MNKRGRSIFLLIWEILQFYEIGLDKFHILTTIDTNIFSLGVVLLLLRVGDICYNIRKQNDAIFKIEAGKAGLGKFALRVTAPKDKNAADLTERCDIVFLSGRHSDVLVLAQKVLEHGASAIALNNGNCSANTKELIAALCMEKDVPLIDIEGHQHFTAAMDLFVKEIEDFEKKRMQLNSELQNMLIFHDAPNRCPTVMEHYETCSNTGCCVAVLKFVCKEDSWLHQEMLSKVERFAAIGVNEVAAETAAVPVGSRIALIFDGKAQETVKAATESAVAAIPGELAQHFAIYVGTGRHCCGMEHLFESFTTASKAADIQTVRNRENFVLSYEELGISKLLMGLDCDSNMVNDFYCETIKPLVEYDKRNGTDYVSFLRLYFEYGGHIKKIGEELYMHRNSVNYKVNKISGIVERDLSDMCDRSEMLVALRLYELLLGENML